MKKTVKKLPRVHTNPMHIDHADSCCMTAWSGQGSHANVVGWMPSPVSEDFCPVALVCECPTCFETFWTHYCWIPIPLDYLPVDAVRRLEQAERQGRIPLTRNMSLR